MRRKMFYIIIFIVISSSFTVDAGETPGMLTFPANQGNVLFNHKKHEQGTDCKTCHDRKGGKIKGLGKVWAHKVCKGCHEAMMLGPVKCEGCHISSIMKK